MTDVKPRISRFSTGHLIPESVMIKFIIDEMKLEKFSPYNDSSIEEFCLLNDIHYQTVISVCNKYFLKNGSPIVPINRDKDRDIRYKLWNRNAFLLEDHNVYLTMEQLRLGTEYWKKGFDPKTRITYMEKTPEQTHYFDVCSNGDCFKISNHESLFDDHCLNVHRKNSKESSPFSYIAAGQTRVHRIVAAAFMHTDECLKGLVVDHINSEPLVFDVMSNNATNLYPTMRLINKHKGTCNVYLQRCVDNESMVFASTSNDCLNEFISNSILKTESFDYSSLSDIINIETNEDLIEVFEITKEEIPKKDDDGNDTDETEQVTTIMNVTSLYDLSKLSSSSLDDLRLKYCTKVPDSGFDEIED